MNRSVKTSDLNLKQRKCLFWLARHLWTSKHHPSIRSFCFWARFSAFSSRLSYSGLDLRSYYKEQMRLRSQGSNDLISPKGLGRSEKDLAGSKKTWQVQKRIGRCKDSAGSKIHSRSDELILRALVLERSRSGKSSCSWKLLIGVLFLLDNGSWYGWLFLCAFLIIFFLSFIPTMDWILFYGKQWKLFKEILQEWEKRCLCVFV